MTSCIVWLLLVGLVLQLRPWSICNAAHVEWDSHLIQQLHSNDTQQQLSALRSIGNDIAQSSNRNATAARYAGDVLRAILRRLAGEPGDSSVQRQAATLLETLMTHGGIRLIDGDAVLLVVRLLDHENLRAERIATSILAGQWDLGRMGLNVMEALANSGAVGKLSPLLRSADTEVRSDAADALRVVLTAVKRLGDKRADTLPASLASFVDAGLLPNAMAAHQNCSVKKPDAGPLMLASFTCVLLVYTEDVDNGYYAHTVEHGCVELNCEAVEHSQGARRGTVLMSALMYFTWILRRSSPALSRRAANILMANAGCLDAIRRLRKPPLNRGDDTHRITAAAKSIVADLSLHARGVYSLPTINDLRKLQAYGSYRMPRRRELLSSPWVPRVGLCFAILLGLFVLWQLFLQPWRRRCERRLAEQHGRDLLAAEEAEKKRGRKKARQPTSSARRRTVVSQPSSPAAGGRDGGGDADDDDDDNDKRPLSTACQTPREPLSDRSSGMTDNQDDRREGTMNADDGQWTAAARSRSKKARKGGALGRGLSAGQTPCEAPSVVATTWKRSAGRGLVLPPSASPPPPRSMQPLTSTAQQYTHISTKQRDVWSSSARPHRGPPPLVKCTKSVSLGGCHVSAHRVSATVHLLHARRPAATTEQGVTGSICTTPSDSRVRSVC
ncbi:unnamed protein product [Vitrella brassicaformis CCMP3155]|uniref:Uncharacterized protein n=1 Tax=Vitrella brassicaformis (strain CCMP3155) TaxID=1169540 RepID=A0A0G4H6A4_VITBC|nr:unnamed protein product [Vitrella brassicaformis CCMP3155]|eukprot:CEM39390.1 unnamed protein product [Vitrella brassicaformis CCMP3155]